MRYYIYKTNRETGVTRYWDRKAGNWSKWFDDNCYYPTQRGVSRIYNAQAKYISVNEVIGWESVQTVKRDTVMS